MTMAFSHNEETVTVIITELLLFEVFGQAYDVLGDKLIPGSNRNEVITLYNNLFHYQGEDVTILNNNTSRMISEQGVVAIGIRVI